MRKQRIDQNSSDLMKLSGGLTERITKTLLYGKPGKSPVGLNVEKIKGILKDFATQIKEEKIWRNKQYLEKRRVIGEKVKNIRTKGENSQLPWKEVNEFEDEEFNGFCSDFEQNGQKYTRIWKRKLEIGKN